MPPRKRAASKSTSRKTKKTVEEVDPEPVEEIAVEKIESTENDGSNEIQDDEPYNPEAEDEPYNPEAEDEPYNPEAEDEPYNPEAEDEPYNPEAEEEPYNPEAEDEPYNPEAEDEPYNPEAEEDTHKSKRVKRNNDSDSDSDSDIDIVLAGSGQAPPQAFQRIPLKPNVNNVSTPANLASSVTTSTANNGTEVANDNLPQQPQQPINLRSSAIISIAKLTDTPTEPRMNSGTEPIYSQPIVNRPALPIAKTDGTNEPSLLEGIEQNLPPDFDNVGKYNGKDIYDVDLEEIQEKNWRRPGAVLSDYFNYGFDEWAWKRYVARRKQMLLTPR